MRRFLSRGERAVLIAVVVVVACLLRAGFVHETHVPNPIRADAAHYAQYAQNLHAHGVYSFDPGQSPRPDSFRSPGYPVFLWLHVLVFGADQLYEAARWTQVLLDTATVVLAFLIARGLLPFAGAVVAAALTGASPHLVANTGYLLTETLTTFTLTLALWSLLRVLRGGGGGACCAAAWAAATLTNEALLPVPFLLAWLAWPRAGWGEGGDGDGAGAGARRRALLAVVAVCALAHGAWAMRNASLPIDAPRGSSRALQTISHGTYPGLVFRDPQNRCMPYRDDPEQPRFGEDLGHFQRVLGQRVAERPLRYLAWYALEKPLHVWGFDGLQATRDIYTYAPSQSLYDKHAVAGVTLWLMRALHWPLVLLAALALFVRRPARARDPIAGPVRLLGACLIYGTVLGVVFAPWPRYVIPMRPVLFVLGVAGAMRAWEIVASHRPARAQSAAPAPS